MKYLLSLIILLQTYLSALSIDEAVKQTIETNPQLEVKKEELMVEKVLLDGSKADYLPTIDLSYSVGPEVTHTIQNNGTRENNTHQEAAINLKQNVFAGLDTLYKVKQQEALILSAGSNVQSSANIISLEVVTEYINILKNKELLNISEENMNVHKKYLAQIKEKLDAGVGRSSDYRQTLSRYENSQSVYFLSKQNYENAISTFQRILPVEADAENLVKPVIGELPATTIEDLVDMAFKNNPSIHVSQADIKYADAALQRSNSNYYPHADITARAYWNDELNGVRTDMTDEDGYNVLLVLSYNLFNGLLDQSNKEANQHRLLTKRSSLADTKRYIKAYTEIAWRTFNSTKEQLVHIEKNIEASAGTVEDYQKEHELGRRSIIDLLNIELEYNNARNRKVSTEYDRITAYYQILTYTGKILETMDVVIEQ